MRWRRDRRAESNVRIRYTVSLLHYCSLSDGGDCGHGDPGANAGGPVPADQHSSSRRSDLLFGNATATDQDKHHESIRKIFYAGERDRSHRVAIAAGRELDQDLLPAWNERGFGS